MIGLIFRQSKTSLPKIFSSRSFFKSRTIQSLISHSNKILFTSKNQYFSTISDVASFTKVQQVLDYYKNIKSISHDELSEVLKKLIQGELEENPDIEKHQAWDHILADLKSNLPYITNPKSLFQCVRFIQVYQSDNAELNSLLQQNLRENIKNVNVMTSLDLLGIIYSFKDKNSKSSLVQIIFKKLKGDINKMNEEETSLFTALYAFYLKFSVPVQSQQGKFKSVFIWNLEIENTNKFIARLQKQILSSVDLYNTDQLSRIFAAICVSNGHLKFPLFIGSVKQRILQKITEFPKDVLVEIAGAFSIIQPQNSEVFQKLELMLSHQIQVNITIYQAIRLVKYFSQANQGTSDLYTKLDMLFGKNLKSIHSSYIDSILDSFVRSGKFRQKLLVAFQRKIADDIAKLTLSQICSILRIYTQAGSEYDTVYQLLEPYVYQNLNDLSIDDICSAIVGYLNPKLKKAFPVLDDLFNELLMRQNQLNIANLTVLLYSISTLVEKDKHNSDFMKMLLERISVAINLQKQVPKTQDLLYLLVALSQLSIGPQLFISFGKLVINNVENGFIRDNHLLLTIEIYQSLIEQCNNDNDMRNAVKSIVQKLKAHSTNMQQPV